MADDALSVAADKLNDALAMVEGLFLMRFRVSASLESPTLVYVPKTGLWIAGKTLQRATLGERLLAATYVQALWEACKIAELETVANAERATTVVLDFLHTVSRQAQNWKGLEP